MLLKRWTPFSELRRMDSDFDRIWGHTLRPIYRRPRFSVPDGHVEVDVYNEEDNLVVRASLPGVKPEDLKVTVADSILTISGESKAESEAKEENYLHRERRYGSFSRSVSLPRHLDAAKADASYENGVLTVTVPRDEESKPKLLEVKVKSKSLTGKKG